jgi:hypothetical protein
MEYSKRYVYEENMEDTTRICVDNLLETLQEKGIFGLLYEEFDVVEEFPLIAYDETTVDVAEKLGTVLRFKYKNEYIYMALDASEGKMYFVTYAGRIEDFYNDKYEYNVKIMNDLWLTKVNDVSVEGFVLFTGFPNLQHNKVLDIYFDNKTESFSSLDKNFAIDVHEFDETWNDSVINGGDNYYDKNTDLIHAYGNNPFPLASGLIAYKYARTVRGIDEYDLMTGAEPAISTIIDPGNKKAFLMVPSLKTNGLYTKSISQIRTQEFLTNYMARYLHERDKVDDWVDEAEAGSYQYSMTLAYYTNGWTMFKYDDNTYKAAKLNNIKIEYVYSGAVEHLAMKKVESLKKMADAMLDEGLSISKVEEKVVEKIRDFTNEINNQISVQVKAMKSTFTQEIMIKNNQISSVVSPDDHEFKFERFLGADDVFINNKPTGPVQNHAILFEDTFKNVYQRMQDEYFADMDMEALPATIYCPYLKETRVDVIDRVAKIYVSSDMSTSVEMLRNDRIGISAMGDMLSDDGNLVIGSKVMSAGDAFTKRMKIQYFGVRRIKGVFHNIYKISTFKQMTEEAKEAYLELMKVFNQSMSSQTGYDYETAKASAHEKHGISGGSVNIDPPEMIASQPMFIANTGSKIMVSLDGESFVDAPVVSDGSYLTARLFMNDKARFLSTLRNMVNADVNNISYPLHQDDVLVNNDVYSIGVKEIAIDYNGVEENGTVDISILLKVSN